MKSKYFSDWAIEEAPQALKVLNRMARSAQGALVDQDGAQQELREAAAEAMLLHPQSADIRAFVEELAK